MKSKILAAVLFLMIIIVLCMTFSMRTEWWMFIDILFAFLAAFLHLMAVTVAAKLPAMRRQIDMAAFVCCIAFFVSFLVIWIIL